jgi:hypothetical protein
MVPQTTAQMAQVRMRRKRSSADSTRRSSRTPRRAPACCNAAACCNTLSLFPERRALRTSTAAPSASKAAATIPGPYRETPRAASSTRDRPGGTGPQTAGCRVPPALGHSLCAGCVTIAHSVCSALSVRGLLSGARSNAVLAQSHRSRRRRQANAERPQQPFGQSVRERRRGPARRFQFCCAARLRFLHMSPSPSRLGTSDGAFSAARPPCEASLSLQPLLICRKLGRSAKSAHLSERDRRPCPGQRQNTVAPGPPSAAPSARTAPCLYARGSGLANQWSIALAGPS